jgi:hypothetical protein
MISTSFDLLLQLFSPNRASTLKFWGHNSALNRRTDYLEVCYLIFTYSLLSKISFPPQFLILFHVVEEAILNDFNTFTFIGAFKMPCHLA